MLKVNHHHPLCTTTYLCLVHTLQRFYRWIVARRRWIGQVRVARCLDEYKAILRGRWCLRQLQIAMKEARRRSLARWMIQGFGRRVLAARTVTERRAYLLKVEQIEQMVNSSAMQRCLMQKVWTKAFGSYCDLIVQAIRRNERIEIGSSRRRREKERERHTKHGKTNSKQPSGSGSGSSSGTKKEEPPTTTAAHQASRTAVDHSGKVHIFAGKPYRNLRQIAMSKSLESLSKGTTVHKRQQEAGTHAFSATVSATTTTPTPTNNHSSSSSSSLRKAFQSTEFHQALVYAKQSGVFLYECHEQKLLAEEVEYFLQFVPATLCQHVNAEAMTRLRSFHGRKLSLIGGEVSEVDMRDCLLPLLYNTSKLEGGQQSVSELNLQLNELRIGFPAIVCLSRLLAGTATSSTLKSSSGTDISSDSVESSIGDKQAICPIVQDLTLDISSVGSLGLVVLLCSLQVYPTIYMCIL